MTATDQRRKVWAIPLAQRGFVSIDPVTNPVHWYLHDYVTDKCVDTKPYATMQEANDAARRMGFDVQGGA